MRDQQKEWRKKVLLVLAVVAGILVGVEGCTYENTPSLTDPKIKAGPAEVYVKPDYETYRFYRLAILPFRVPPQVPDVGYPLTEVFHRELLQNKTFLAVVRVPEYYNTLDEAKRLGKKYNAELILLGEVPYFIDSGTTGRSGLQVDLRVLETNTGRIVWYLSDTISSVPREIIDLWVTETRPKPSASINFLAENLAARMCHSLQNDLAQCIGKKLCTPDSNVKNGQ